MNLKEILDWFESDAGKESVRVWEENLMKQNVVIKRWCNKFSELSIYDRSSIIEKILCKYSSDTYRDRWYKRGLEPQEYLLSILFIYASVFGKEYLSRLTFADECYVFDHYKITRLNGQGTCIIVDRI